MKNKIAILSIFVLVATFGFTYTAKASTVCGDPSLNNASSTTVFVGCANGMPVPNPVGWAVVAPGVYDCPAWFPFAGCVIPPSAFAKYGLTGTSKVGFFR